MATNRAKADNPRLAYTVLSPPHVLTESLRAFQKTHAGRDLRLLLDVLPPHCRPFVMGGLLRDMLLERVLRIPAKPADIDIVIFGAASLEEVLGKFADGACSRNAFGGIKYRFRPRGILFDLWRVEDHTNMDQGSKPYSIEQLLRHNLLDVDAILWDPTTDQLHDCGCLQAITSGKIGLASPEGVSRKFVASQVAHVLTVACKTKFPLSEELRSFVAKASGQCAKADVDRILERKIPHAAGHIERFWNDLLGGGLSECPTPARTTMSQTARMKRSSSLLNTRH